MRRRFTKDVGLHFNTGQVVDYDSMTWRHIERNLKDLGLAESLEDVSETVDDETPLTKRKEPGIDERVNASPKKARKKTKRKKARKRAPKKKAAKTRKRATK